MSVGLGGPPTPIDIVVREATPDDWELWRELRLGALIDSPLAFASTHESEIGLDEQFWRTRLADPENTCLIASSYGRPVGIAGGYLRDDERGPDGVIPELVSMWVRPEARGLGAARALIDAVCRWTQSQGRDELRLFVTEGNESVQRIYTRLGFAFNGYHQPTPHDPSRQEFEMVRSLGPATP